MDFKWFVIQFFGECKRIPEVELMKTSANSIKYFAYELFYPGLHAVIFRFFCDNGEMHVS